MQKPIYSVINSQFRSKHGSSQADSRSFAVNSFVVEGDLNDQALLARLFKLAGITHVLHLAAQVSTDVIRG